MADYRLIAKNIGPIKEADVRFGDLTVLVGPQASGKSIFLQMFKLLEDTKYILQVLGLYGISWDGDPKQFFEVYFGEGMSRLWSKTSKLIGGGREVDLNALVRPQLMRDPSRTNRLSDKVLYVPAHRVLSLMTGWPRPFRDYLPTDPFVLRDFSDSLRMIANEAKEKSIGVLFPWPNEMAPDLRRILNRDVFGDFELVLDKETTQTRFVLKRNGQSLPFLGWSSGQREIVPLLLSLYPLNLTASARIGVRKCVVIEELEMGLHPRAISSVMLLVLRVLSLGFRVCLSTHSADVLDVVWAMRLFKQHGTPPDQLLKIFGVEPSTELTNMAAKVMEKTARVYYFGPDSSAGKSTSHDISDLDPGSPDRIESGWGGLTQFSGDVGEIIGRAIAEASH